MIVEYRFVGTAARSPEFTPEEKHELYGIQPLVALAERKCSLVVGEPGSGKSTAVRSLASQLATQDRLDKIEVINLRACYSEASLERCFFDLPTIRPDGRNVLIVDSIDEAPVLLRRSVPFFETMLPTLIDKGWRIIAMSRTAETVAALSDLFNELEGGAVHSLLPLRRSDACEVVESYGIDADPIISSLEERELTALAALPFMLRLVCEAYLDDGEIDGSRIDLLEKAVSKLLIQGGEVQSPALPPRQARAAAERIAWFAAMSSSTSIGLFRPGETGDGLETEQIAGHQPSGGQDFEVTHSEMQWVLRTAMFAEAGPNQREFVHRSIRDLLAAHAAHNFNLDERALRGILTTSDEGRSIPPQMLGIATDLLAIGRNYDWLVNCDPLSLARNGVGRERKDLAPALVDSLLHDAAGVEIRLNYQDRLTYLDHPGLTEQLSSWFSESDAAAVVALRILRDSYKAGAETRLVELVMDRTRHYRVRKLAAQVLAAQGEISRLETSQIVMPDFFDGDETNELRGTILDLLWPSHLRTAEMLSLLVPPTPLFYGAYMGFLHRLGKETTQPDIIEIVQWHSRELQSSTSGAIPPLTHDDRLRELVDDTLRRIRPLPSDPAIRDDIAVILHDRLFQGTGSLPLEFESFTNGDWEDLVDRQLKLAREVSHGWLGVARATDVNGRPLIGPNNVGWVIGRCLGATGEDRGLWVDLLRFVVQPYDPATFEMLWALQGTDVWEAVSPFYDVVDLQSPQAEMLRQFVPKSTQRQEEEAAVPREQFLEAIRELIPQVESGHRPFWQLANYLALDESLARWNLPGAVDLLDAPGVELLTDRERQSVLTLAGAYLRDYDRFAPSKIERNTFHYPLLAAFRALHTLILHDETQLPDTWTPHLATAVLEYPSYFDNREVISQSRRRLLQLIRKQNPGMFREQARAYISRCSRSERDTSALSDLPAVFSAEDAGLVRSALGARKASSLAALIELYFAVSPAEAAEWSERCLKTSKNTAKITEAIGGLLRSSPSRGTERLLDLIKRRPDQARAALLGFAATERHEQTRWIRVPERDRVALFEGLSDLFPRSEETFPSGVHSVEPREDLAHWRDGLITQVARSGSRDGLRALRELTVRRPDLAVDQYVEVARESLRLNGWHPIPVVELTAVTERPAARIVRSNDDALEAVIDELATLYEWLTGETPQAFALWDNCEAGRNPKDENTISDWYCHGLRIRLADSGLIINREVEVRNTVGRGVGARQDIRVELRDSAVGENYIVVIEVKGAWNSGVRANLESQLADDYLRRGRLTHGVYLVVDFSEGPISIARKQAASKRNMRGLPDHLLAQAQKLAPELRIIPVIHTVR